MALDDIIKTMFKEYGTLENISKIFSSPTRYEEFVSNSDLFKKIEEVIVKNRWIPGVETILNINNTRINFVHSFKKSIGNFILPGKHTPSKRRPTLTLRKIT